MTKIKRPSFILPIEDLRNTDKKSITPSYNYKKFLNSDIPIKFSTKFKFLSDTNAYQEGAINLTVGRTGKGKTDLVVSQILELACNMHKVYLLISEGDIAEYYRQFQSILNKRNKSEEDQDKILSNIFIKDFDEFPLKELFDYEFWCYKVIKDINQFNCKFFFFDNLSTIDPTNSKPQIESGFIRFFSKTLRKNKIISNFFIHTSKNVSIGEIRIDEIRGNQAHSNICTNIFAFNDVRYNEKELRFISVLKCRTKGEVNNTYYELEYKKLKNRGFYAKNEKKTRFEVSKYFLRTSRTNSNTLNQAKSK